MTSDIRTKIKKVSVIGAGTMGSGIASVILSSGFETILIDVIPASLEKAKQAIEKNLAKSKEKGLIEKEPSELLKSLKFSSELKDINDSDLIIEAVSENVEIKNKVFAEFTAHAKEDAIIATNTSALRISDLAVKYKKPENVLGMHFFNPATIMKLIELIKTGLTCPEVFNKVKSFVLELKKEPVEVKESFGFVVNRILIPMINEAACVFEEGVASAEDIDKAMKLGANHPIGPLALADLIGIDVCLAIMETLQTGLKSDKYKPASILQKYTKEGKLGKKSGEGFFKY